jgi:hypothetical protein
VWRRRGKAASTRISAALYSAYHGLYSEAVVSSTVSAVALVDVGRFREAVEYVQKAAKALYEAAKEVFERVKVTVQRIVELFVEAVTRVLACIDEHKAYLFLMAAVSAGVVALSARAEKYGDPQLITEIKTVLENKLKETLRHEYEQWKNHIKIKGGGRRLVVTQHLLQRLAQQDPNTTKLSEKT